MYAVEPSLLCSFCTHSNFEFISIFRGHIRKKIFNVCRMHIHYRHIPDCERRNNSTFLYICYVQNYEGKNIFVRHFAFCILFNDINLSLIFFLYSRSHLSQLLTHIPNSKVRSQNTFSRSNTCERKHTQFNIQKLKSSDIIRLIIYIRNRKVESGKVD